MLGKMSNEEDIEGLGFSVDLTPDEIRTLLYAVQVALQAWPGYPARPREEQEELQLLRDLLFRMTLETYL
jgi:hypothetical protein